MGRHGIVLAATLVVAATICHAQFEDLSTPELKDLLDSLEYEQEEDYGNGPQDYEYQTDGLNYYDNYDDLAETDPDVQDMLDFVPTQVRQPESLAHAPTLTGPLSRNKPAQKQQAMNNNSNNKGNGNGKGTNSVLPAYCDPPNPCPLGYTEKDGCIEDFENTSEFSRNYQGRQNCLCDSEHMFNCPVDETSHNDASFLSALPQPSLPGADGDGNPYLSGSKLHLTAKKGMGFF